MRKTFLAVLFFVLLTPSYALASFNEVAIKFSNGAESITGILVLPKSSSGPFPVALFVHGDGALTYDAYGYYRHLWKILALNGIASLAWNKLGVEDSTGDWEKQSMHDRAEEVEKAIAYARSNENIDKEKVGLIGFSQAGWVIPLVNEQESLAFNVIVSGAINWVQQGNYLTRQRFQSLGFSENEIQSAIESNILLSEQLTSSITYIEYQKLREQEYSQEIKKHMPVMKESRFEFAKLNWQYDATKSIKNISAPTLFVFGNDDKNVDVNDSIETYSTLVSESAGVHEIALYSGAQHGLLKTKYFAKVDPGVWFLIKLDLLGKHAIANGFLDELTEWVVTNTR